VIGFFDVFLSLKIFWYLTFSLILKSTDLKNMKLFDLATKELNRSNVDRRHPFKYFQLATLDEYPEIRTIVNRNIAEDLSITFFTDGRSPKVDQIKKDPRVSVHFYHENKRLQIRIKGHSRIIKNTDQRYIQYLNQLKNTNSLRDYSSIEAPGTSVINATQILLGETAHFTAVQIKPWYMDIFLLGEKSHERCSYEYINDAWQETVLVP
jgi:pyridoxine/pyridoxamine 5'-phosphate oxidase